MRRLSAEHDNLRAALDWSAARADPDDAGLRLSGALWWFWFVRGDFTEGRRCLTQVLERAGARNSTNSVALTKIVNGAGALAYRQGDLANALASYEEALELCRRSGDETRVASLRNNLAAIASTKGNYPRARALYNDSMDLRRKLGDRTGVANTMNNLGNMALTMGGWTRRARFMNRL